MPPANDITTDTEDPPAFVDLLPHRRRAMNPPDRGGPAVAAQQHTRWPEVPPLDTAAARPRVHTAVREAMHRAGWDVVGDSVAAGRLEAIATTRWWRFKDDVVVRLRDREEGGTRVDVRSKSRVGRHDFGTNARRIRNFLDDLRAHLEGEASA